MVGLIREMIENERNQASKDRKTEFQLENERKQVPKGRKMKENARTCKENALDMLKIHTLDMPSHVLSYVLLGVLEGH